MSLGCVVLLSLEFLSAFLWWYKCSYTFVCWDLSVHKTVLFLARRALKLLSDFDSRRKINGCLTVEEQCVLNNFMIIYQRGACFAVHVHSHFLIYLEKTQYFFFSFRDNSYEGKKVGKFQAAARAHCAQSAWEFTLGCPLALSTI